MDGIGAAAPTCDFERKVRSPVPSRTPSNTCEWCYVEVRKTGDGSGTQNTEEMNGPRLRPMAH